MYRQTDRVTNSLTDMLQQRFFSWSFDLKSWICINPSKTAIQKCLRFQYFLLEEIEESKNGKKIYQVEIQKNVNLHFKVTEINISLCEYCLTHVRGRDTIQWKKHKYPIYLPILHSPFRFLNVRDYFIELVEMQLHMNYSMQRIQ